VKFSEIIGDGDKSTQLKLSGLDSIDLKLLEALDKNSRTSYAELAKIVGLSRDGVKYRMIRLEKRKVILDFNLNVNLRSLGLSRVLLNISFISLDDELSERFELFVREFATELFKTAGDYDYVVLLAIRNNEHLNSFIQQIKAQFPDKIRSIGVVPVVD